MRVKIYRMQNKTIIIFIIILIIVVAGVVTLTSFMSSSSRGPNLTAFAQCLTNSGAKFYGAFWCPHCQAEKALFGAAVSKLPYVECSTPDANGQTQVCINEGIKEYPTWIFANGTRVEGVQTLAQLSAETGCPLPSAAASTTPSSFGASQATIVGSTSPATSPVSS